MEEIQTLMRKSKITGKKKQKQTKKKLRFTNRRGIEKKFLKVTCITTTTTTTFITDHIQKSHFVCFSINFHIRLCQGCIDTHAAIRYRPNTVLIYSYYWTQVQCTSQANHTALKISTEHFSSASTEPHVSFPSLSSIYTFLIRANF